MNHTLVQYIRDADRTPRGVVVATIRPTDDKVAIGFSAVKPNSGDKFNKELGKKIAINRAASTEEPANKDFIFAKLKKKNPEAYGAIYNMYHRALTYFKGKEVVLP